MICYANITVALWLQTLLMISARFQEAMSPTLTLCRKGTLPRSLHNSVIRRFVLYALIVAMTIATFFVAGQIVHHLLCR